jgi:putative sterol carrier protein
MRHYQEKLNARLTVLDSPNFRFVFIFSAAVKLLIDKNGGSAIVQFITTAPAKDDCQIQISEEDFLAILDGKLNPQVAFRKGLLTISGNFDMALRLHFLFGIFDLAIGGKAL